MRMSPYGGLWRNAPARKPTTTAVSAGPTPPITATATTASSVQKRKPARPRDDLDGSKPTATSKGPATARTRAAERRRRGNRTRLARSPKEATTRRSSALIPVSVTDNRQRDHEPNAGRAGG